MIDNEKRTLNATRLGAWASVAMALVGLVGTILVVAQLMEFKRQNNSAFNQIGELKKQNELLEKSFLRSYRPVGVVVYDTTGNGRMPYGMPEGTYQEGSFNFECNPWLFNYGNSILVYIGSISYISEDTINFRRALLAGELDTFNIDGLRDILRRVPIQPNKYIAAKVVWYYIPINEHYYLYTIFLYEDQDGYLFDTERSDLINFELKNGPDGKNRVVRVKDYLGKELYHRYNESEKDSLIQRFREINHPLARVLMGN